MLRFDSISRFMNFHLQIQLSKPISRALSLDLEEMKKRHFTGNDKNQAAGGFGGGSSSISHESRISKGHSSVNHLVHLSMGW